MSEERLMRALGAGAAPKLDPRFVLTVMERAERKRYEAERAAGVLRAAGLAAAGATLLIMLGSWAGTHAEVAQTVVLSLGVLLGLTATARTLARLSPASR
ncbi:hypothetical protein [Terricaulis sp.]|uniref:hypothetical protein n=1 Tax=Terricaulis sp. TaxID=2768686 RepID=UPI003783D860